MNVLQVLREHERAVVIVHYRPAEAVDHSVYQGCPPPQNPAVFLQVTLCVDKVSPSGKLIRLGETRGDEILGWTHVEALEVIELLGELAADGATVIAFPRAASAKEAS